jgi:hypothetical protein
VKSKATILEVPVSLQGFDSQDVQVIGHLANAANLMTPVYALQSDPHSLEMLRALRDIERRAPPEFSAAIGEYITLFCLRNGPYDAENHAYPFVLNQHALPKDHPIQQFGPQLFAAQDGPQGRGLYPSDLTQKEFESLGPLQNLENSTVVRDASGRPVVVRNEDRFSHLLAPVIGALEKARAATSDRDLRAYIGAKIAELKEGSAASREESDLAWLANTGPIDFILGTAIESYLDKAHGVRSAAMGTVYVTDTAYADLTKTLTGLLPQWEATAPWKHKKRVDERTLPRLRYVNAVTRAGYYEMFPMIIAAQSLPNSQDFKQRHGGANVVFSNVTKARLGNPRENLVLNEFVPRTEVEKYQGLINDMYLLMIAAHELGHTTGGSVIEEDPRTRFGDEVHRMEEGRAELFSMWVLPRLVSEGVITQEQEIAGYYSMAQTIFLAMAQKPFDHNGARNIMFHYFVRHGALVEVEEGGRIKYTVNPEKMREQVPLLLGQLGDIKATGDVDGLKQLKGEYLSEADRATFQRRLEHVPLGLGSVFPNMVHDGNKYTGRLVMPRKEAGELILPANYRGQRRSLENFL